jgi:hypothetical protein
MHAFRPPSKLNSTIPRRCSVGKKVQTKRVGSGSDAFFGRPGSTLPLVRYPTSPV